jgi:uncharacterized protein
LEGLNRIGNEGTSAGLFTLGIGRKIMALSKDLLEIIACPKCVRDPGCTGELEYREKENQLVCHHCKLIYRIEDDIPIMLIDEATPLENSK